MLKCPVLTLQGSLDPEIVAVLNDPAANVTILSPPAEALQALVSPDITSEEVEDILLAHILVDPLTADDLIAEGDGAEIETVNEDITLELSLEDGVAFVLGNITATVITPDVASCASQSVIHLIDAVLIPGGLETVVREPVPDVATPEEDGVVSVSSIIPAVVAAVLGAAMLL